MGPVEALVEREIADSEQQLATADLVRMSVNRHTVAPDFDVTVTLPGGFVESDLS